MKKHVIIAYSTPYPSEIKMGQYRIIFKDGLIQDIQRRTAHGLKSQLYKEAVEKPVEPEVQDAKEEEPATPSAQDLLDNFSKE